MAMHLQRRQALRVHGRWQALLGAISAPRAPPGRQRRGCPQKAPTSRRQGHPSCLASRWAAVGFTSSEAVGRQAG